MIGGFNLDRSNQNFADGDIIPGGVLAIANEETRLVQVIKTEKSQKWTPRMPSW